jgi:PAS domain S-box-containing protein
MVTEKHKTEEGSEPFMNQCGEGLGNKSGELRQKLHKLIGDLAHKLDTSTYREFEQLFQAMEVELSELEGQNTALRKSQQELEAAHRRYELVLAGADAGIWDWDVLEHKVEFSARWKSMRGFTDDEVRGAEEEWSCGIHPEDRARVMAAIQTHFEGDSSSFSEEYRVCRKDGTWMWISDHGLARRDASGRVVRMAGSEVDITERKQAEDALRQSREDLDRAQMVGQIGSWRLDTQRNVLTWSDENHRIFGVPTGTPLTYEAFIEIVHPDDRQYVDTQWKAALGGEPYDIEHRLLVDGEVKWVRERAYLEFSECGALLGGFGITQDITTRKQVEQSLCESEAKLRSAFANAVIGFAMTTVDGQFVNANPAYCRLTGYSIEELLTLPFELLIHPDDRAENLRLFNLMINGQIADFTIENRYVRKGGEAIWVRKSISLVRSSSGVPQWTIALIEDISAHKRAMDENATLTRELQRRAAELQTIFETVPIGLAISDDSEAHRIRGNPAIERLFGVGPDKDRAESALQPSCFRMTQNGAEISVAEMPMQRAARGEVVAGQVIDLVREDGQLITLYSCATPLTDETGSPRGAVGAFLDITNRKQAELELRQSRERLAWVLETTGIGLWLNELPFGRLNWDNRTCELFFVPAGVEPTIDLFWARLHPDDHEPTRQAVEAAIRDGTLYSIDHRVVNPTSGDVRWLRSVGHATYASDGTPVRFDGINYEITEHKMAEERMRSSLDEKEVLLKEIHHRVKNNMQVICSLVGLQAERAPSAAMRVVLQNVTHRVRSMALVHEKLYQSTDLAQIEFGEYAYNLLQYLWRAHAATASSVRLSTDLEPVHISVNAAVPCGLILNELVSNSLKHAFLDQTDGEVSVSLRGDPNGQVCLRVRDNGKGLPAEFDWRQSNSLGLHLVHLLAGQLHATVEVAASQGTEFVVTFRAPKP